MFTFRHPIEDSVFGETPDHTPPPLTGLPDSLAPEPVAQPGSGSAQDLASLFGHYAEPAAAPHDSVHAPHPRHADAAPAETIDMHAPIAAPAAGAVDISDKLPLDQQSRRADDLVAEIEAGIASEDYHSDDGADPLRRPTKDAGDRVRPKLAAELSRVKALAREAARGGRTSVRAYVTAAVALEKHYLATPLVSTDAGADKIKAPAEGSATLASVSPQDLKKWMEKGGFVKFAVPPGGGMRVGPASMSHVQIAGGPAVSAGILNFTFDKDGKPHASELENTSGGFRPGALRNNTALAELQAGHLLPSGGTKVLMNRTGAYHNSALSPDGTTVPEDEIARPQTYTPPT